MHWIEQELHMSAPNASPVLMQLESIAEKVGTLALEDTAVVSVVNALLEGAIPFAPLRPIVGDILTHLEAALDAALKKAEAK